MHWLCKDWEKIIYWQILENFGTKFRMFNLSVSWINFNRFSMLKLKNIYNQLNVQIEMVPINIQQSLAYLAYLIFYSFYIIFIFEFFINFECCLPIEVVLMLHFCGHLYFEGAFPFNVVFIIDFKLVLISSMVKLKIINEMSNQMAIGIMKLYAAYQPADMFRCTQIKTYSWDNAQVILVGNKCDMEDERVISYERGKQLADSLGLEFFETSAKENINVRVSILLHSVASLHWSISLIEHWVSIENLKIDVCYVYSLENELMLNQPFI